MRGYIPFEKEALPNLFEIDLAGQSFFIGLNYNRSQDLFTIDLYDVERKAIVLGEFLVLNERLWADIIDERLPKMDIVPMDESLEAKDITFGNFMVTVFLYVDDVSTNFNIPILGGGSV